MTDTTHTYWISIGRNVGIDGPIEHYAWQLFKGQVVAAVLDSGGAILSTVDGNSAWNGDEEECYLLLASLPSGQVPQLKLWLANLATDWAQDAIGFVGGPGTDTLIEGR
jgi:hypothetical protein